MTISDPFWLPKLHTYRDNSISAGWRYVEGALQELEYLATGKGPTPENVPWVEANLYKLMEAAAYWRRNRPAYDRIELRRRLSLGRRG